MGFSYSAAVFVGACVTPTQEDVVERRCSHALPEGPEPPKFCSVCGRETFCKYKRNVQEDLIEFDEDEGQWIYHGYEVIINEGSDDWYIGRQLVEIDPRYGETEVIPVEQREASLDTIALCRQLEADGFTIVSSGLMLISLVH